MVDEAAYTVPPGIAAVSFDLDETLFACAPVLAKAEASLHMFMASRYPALKTRLDDVTLAAYVARVLEAHPHRHWDVSFLKHEALALACADVEAIPPEAARECFEHFLHERSTHCEGHLFDGVVPALAALRARGLRLATISNGNADPARVHSLAGLVEVHVSAAEAKAAKPHAAPFALLASKLGLKPQQIMHVGDDYQADVLGAKAAGFGGAVWISTFTGSDDVADAVLESVAQLR